MSTCCLLICELSMNGLLLMVKQCKGHLLLTKPSAVDYELASMSNNCQILMVTNTARSWVVLLMSEQKSFVGFN